MKVCIIGTGRMGRRHIDAARGLGFEVAGIFDPSVEAMNLAVKDHGVEPERCYHSIESMLQKCRPEGLVVSSTAPGHASQVIAASNAGVKYILCEKPMALSLKECDEMIGTCKTNGTILGINHQMRFMEQYTAVKEMAQSEAFGGLHSVTVASSNFGLAMNASHYFEMFRFMADEEIATINFWSDSEKVPNPRGPQYEDRSGQIRAVTKSGVRLYIELGGDQGHGVQVIYGCRYGQIFVDELAGHVRAIARKAEFRDMPTTRYGMPADEIVKTISPVDVITSSQDVWRSMLANKNYPNGECGRHALLALVAANISGENGGKPVQLQSSEVPLERIFPWA